MKVRYFFALLVLNLVTFTGIAQQKKIDKANKEYDKFAYVDAQKVFEKVVENGYASLEIFQKLGDSYYFNSDYYNAAKWYSQLMDNYGKEVDSEYYFRYAQALKAISEYDQSDVYMAEFFQRENKEVRAKNYADIPDYLERISFQSGRYKLKNLSSNSGNSDFGPAFYGENLVFASSRDTGVFNKRVHKWNNKPFLDLYTGKISKDGDDVPSVKGLSAILNSKYHESTPVFTKDLNTVYFTRNNYNKGKYGKAKNGINKLKIYRSTKSKAGIWSLPESLSINNDEYVVAHPALSADEKKLYYTSNKPGGYGLSDLYVVDIKEDGTLGEPKNLGPKINTEGKESFPFVGKKSNDLYFASDGHVGLGGLDLFVTNLNAQDVAVGEIINLGEPANSPNDDFAFILNEDTKMGYLSSNRDGGKGDDDIYWVQQLKDVNVICNTTIKGDVRDKVSGELLPNAKVTLFDTSNKILATKIADENAQFELVGICGKNYFVRAEKRTYDSHEKLVKTEKKGSDTYVELNLVKSVKVTPITLGKDLGKILQINPIYFNFDKSNIRRDAALELAKIIAVLQEYPKMKIDVRSHTDSRGNDEYNRKLSDRRVKSTIKYMIKKGGISADRLTGRGYGEEQCVNECSNGVDCSEEDHQLNRRSEFIIVEK